MSDGEFGSIRPNWTNAIVSQYVEDLRAYEEQEEKNWSVEKPRIYVFGASLGFGYSVAEAVYHFALGLFRAAQALIGIIPSRFMAKPLFPEATRLVVLEHFVQVGRYTLLAVPLLVCPFIFGLEETAKAFVCLQKEVQPQEQVQPVDNKAAITNLQQQIADLTANLDAITTDKEELNKQLKESRQATIDSGVRNHTIALEYASLKGQVEQLQRSEVSFCDLEEANRQLEDAKKNYEELKQRLAQKESECTEKDETIGVLNQEISSLEELVKGSDPFLLEKDLTIQEKEKEIERLNARVHELWKENRSLKEANRPSPSTALDSQLTVRPTLELPTQTLLTPSSSIHFHPTVSEPVISTQSQQFESTPNYTLRVVSKGGSFIPVDQRQSIKVLRSRGIQPSNETFTGQWAIWLNNRIQPYGFSARLKKLDDWADGKPFFALADILVDGFYLMKFPSAETKINAAFDIFAKYGANKLFDAEDAGNWNEQSLTTYLMGIHEHCFNKRKGDVPEDSQISVQPVTPSSTSTTTSRPPVGLTSEVPFSQRMRAKSAGAAFPVEPK
ncbi:MAG: hypothetical protein ACXU9U_01015 [Parachlamydiaceae bacterium]